jgi:hypothetical protein
MLNLACSYINTIKTMDLSIVKPFTETEVHPLYAKEWLRKLDMLQFAIMKNEVKKPSLRELVNCYPNPSVIRSCLINTLFDCYFAKAPKHQIQNIVEMYNTLLSSVYSNDMYSFDGTNINYSKNELLKDCYAINSNPSDNAPFLPYLLHFSYLVWGDIYADNLYEVTGPFKYKGNTFIVFDFNNIYPPRWIWDIPLDYYNKLKRVTIVKMFDTLRKPFNVKIDLFGHYIYNSKESYEERELIKINDEIVTRDQQKQYYEELNVNLKKYTIHIRLKPKIFFKEQSYWQRIYREINVFQKVKLSIENEAPKLTWKFKKRRIIDPVKLNTMILSVLKKGELL